MNMKRQEVRNKVMAYPTKYKEGFTDIEKQLFVLTEFPNINRDKFNQAFFGNTCMRIDNFTITYHVDMVNAIMCGIEDRDLRIGEWD